MSLMYELLRVSHNLAAGTATPCLDGSTNCQTNLPGVAATGIQVHQILAILFGIMAAVSVLFIVIGGLRFVTSEGNPEGTAKARNTIIYAVVGLVIALSAEALVAFVLGNL
jgi:hypothetical protein